MNPQLKILLFVVTLVLLLLFQAKGVMPVVYDIVSSDLFLEKSDDKGDMQSVSTEFTQMAFIHCNKEIQNQLGSEYSIAFPEKPLNAWGIGNYQYVINADIEITKDSQTFSKRYVCRTQYENTDEMSGMSEFDNWSFSGISGLNI